MNATRCAYLLPIRRTSFSTNEATDLSAYFASLSGAGCDVLVIDGSPEAVFNSHHEVWRNVARHEKVDRRFGYLNDKVNGIHTGVELAPNAKIILADDDIRYTAAEIGQVCDLLEEFEVVRPQNYLKGWIDRSAGDAKGMRLRRYAVSSSKALLDPPGLPWWVRIESARMLVNRATLRAADYPGTCGFHRQTMLRAGHHDGDVLFDNEELIRHLAREGARIYYANDLFVEKRAPGLRKWFEQRPRQAYEDFGLRAKTALFFSLPPLALVAGTIFGSRGVIWFAAIVVLSAISVAFAGWRRGAARNYFPLSTIFFAPLWIFERTVSTYSALFWYLRHGGYPFGDRVLSKGIGRDWAEGGKIGSQLATKQARKKQAL